MWNFTFSIVSYNLKLVSYDFNLKILIQTKSILSYFSDQISQFTQTTQIRKFYDIFLIDGAVIQKKAYKRHSLVEAFSKGLLN